MSCKWQTNLYALPACIEGPTLFGGIIMSNDYVFNDTLPVAPLKIAALGIWLRKSTPTLSISAATILKS